MKNQLKNQQELIEEIQLKNQFKNVVITIDQVNKNQYTKKLIVPRSSLDNITVIDGTIETDEKY